MVFTAGTALIWTHNIFLLMLVVMVASTFLEAFFLPSNIQDANSDVGEAILDDDGIPTGEVVKFNPYATVDLMVGLGMRIAFVLALGFTMNWVILPLL